MSLKVSRLSVLFAAAFLIPNTFFGAPKDASTTKTQNDAASVEIVIAVISSADFEAMTSSTPKKLRMDPETRMPQAEKVFKAIDEGEILTWGQHEVRVGAAEKVFFEPEVTPKTEAFILKALYGDVEVKKTSQSNIEVWCDVHCSYYDRVDQVGYSGPVYAGKRIYLSEEYPAEMLDFASRQNSHLIFLARLLPANKTEQSNPITIPKNPKNQLD